MRRVVFVGEAKGVKPSTPDRMRALAEHFDGLTHCFWCGEYIPLKQGRCTCKCAFVFDAAWRRGD
jgi:hypothetical protein